MKKLFITLIAIVMFAPIAFANDHFDDGYREMSESGHVYLTSSHETVFVCNGEYITSAQRPNVTCLRHDEIMSKRAKKRTARFFTRVFSYGTYINKQ